MNRSHFNYIKMGRHYYDKAVILNGKGIKLFNWQPPRFNQDGKLELHVPFANYEGQHGL